MIKKLILTVLISGLSISSVFAAVAEESKIFTPYFDMILSEGMYIPSEGNFFSGGVMDMQIGLLAKTKKNQSVFGLYNFKYSGPAFQPQDAKQFQDRELSHGFNFEYRYDFRDTWRVRPGISYTKGFSRTGANEAWKNGLYNMSSLGGQLALDYGYQWLGKDGTVTLQYLMRKITFPNYTDLMREFESAGAASELSGGLQDQTLGQISLRSNWNRFFGGFSYSWQSYENQMAVELTGVYGDTNQKDTNVTLDFGYHHTLWIFEMAPSLAYTLHRSNQNFLRFKSFGAGVDLATLGNGDSNVTLVPDNYDYNELTFNIPVDLLITKKWAVNGGIQLVKRNYTDRPPRDTENNYDFSKTQSNLLTNLTVGLRKRLNEVAIVRLNYTFVVGSSNNNFDKYLPYNYTGQNIGIAYHLSY